VSANEITEELVRRVADDLRERYALDDEDVRTLGARLADDPHVTRRAENDAFAERFTTEHRETSTDSPSSSGPHALRANPR
jgi:hypothetical protein